MDDTKYPPPGTFSGRLLRKMGQQPRVTADITSTRWCGWDSSDARELVNAGLADVISIQLNNHGQALADARMRKENDHAPDGRTTSEGDA